VTAVPSGPKWTRTPTIPINKFGDADVNSTLGSSRRVDVATFAYVPDVTLTPSSESK
jgi:hypothetical protein